MRPKRYRKAQDWVKIAEQIANENGGILPSPQHLIDDGYWALYQTMRRNKNLFEHINQERRDNKKKNGKNWIKEAEQIAENHGGVLPRPSWLCRHGHKTLYTYMLNNRKKFKHIKQDFNPRGAHRKKKAPSDSG